MLGKDEFAKQLKTAKVCKVDYRPLFRILKVSVKGGQYLKDQTRVCINKVDPQELISKKELERKCPEFV